MTTTNHDQLSPQRAAAPSEPMAFAAADYVLFYDIPPQETGSNYKSWYARGQNFIVAYAEVEAGAELTRREQEDEYVLLLPDRLSRVEVRTGNEINTIEGNSLVIVPPGRSSIRVVAGGRCVRLLTTRAQDLLAKCANAASYKEPHPNIPAFQPWPSPPDGYRIRTYSLDVPKAPGSLGRMWRCSTFLVNCIEPRGPRDITKLTPHHHDDFEQCSLSLSGKWEHHLRWPWTANKNHWRDDEHEICESPSVTIIPPPAIHTSVSLDPVRNELVDVYSPPRLDFSSKPGWILNGDEYPMP